MSTLSDTWTDREVDHAWALEVRAWETEHMDDDDVLKLRAETSRMPRHARPGFAAMARAVDDLSRKGWVAPFHPPLAEWYDDDCDQEEER